MVLVLTGRNQEERQEEVRLFISKSAVCHQRDKEAQQCWEIGSHGRQVSNEDKEANVSLKDHTTLHGGHAGQAHFKSSWLWT